MQITIFEKDKNGKLIEHKTAYCRDFDINFEWKSIILKITDREGKPQTVDLSNFHELVSIEGRV